jgi:hypothetical protein
MSYVTVCDGPNCEVQATGRDDEFWYELSIPNTATRAELKADPDAGLRYEERQKAFHSKECLFNFVARLGVTPY